MKRLFITGGTGYLGCHLVQQAQAQGWQVAASYYKQLPPHAADISWLPLDIRDALVLEAVVADFQPHVIIHTAYRQFEPDLWAVTAQGTENVARAALISHSHLIHLSSDVIFNGERTTPYTEAHPPDPITTYGTAKADAERFVRNAAPDSIIVRTSLTYGFDPIDRHTRFILDVADGIRQAQLFTDEYRCPIFVADLAAAVLELARSDYRGVINIAGSEPLSRYELGRLLAQAYGRDPECITPGLSSTLPEPRPRNCVLNIRLAQSMLHTRLRGVREVLEQHCPQQ